VKLNPLQHLALLCFALPTTAQVPPVTGVVTDVGVPARFVVDNTPVLCTRETMSYSAEPKQKLGSHVCPQHVIGDAVTAIGKYKSGELIAEAIDTRAPWPAPVDGTAVIERVIAADGKLTLQADGYSIRVTSETKQAWLAPLADHTPVTANYWLRYFGTQEPDGTIAATTLTYSANTLSNHEAKVSNKEEFDPSAITEEDRQGAVSRFLIGTNAKRFPAYKDAAMQQRVETIGAKLVPAFQRNLPDADPAKLNFRFQVVDQEKLKDAVTLTNGIILVPKDVVQRLENDAQLATVLADNIACALEKQTFRQIPARNVMTGTKIATAAAGVFIPGLGLAAGIGESVAASKILKHALEQSGRVSLSLLDDAGYDITQAPVTWWILNSKKPRAKTDMPYRARYLYNQLATTWRPQQRLP
jgi:hypothetical protein